VVVSAVTAREAAGLAASGEFVVLLTDLGLPDVPGDALISKVIGEARRRPRVVAITGFGEPHASHARRAGADAVLTKPVSWGELALACRGAPRAGHDPGVAPEFTPAPA
jgi:DNA-binding response OmpR family regulator